VFKNTRLLLIFVEGFLVFFFAGLDAAARAVRLLSVG
jgi:hypothetical protein